MKNLKELENEAPILKETTDLYKEFYSYLKIFPKKDLYILGKRCEDNILDFLELILLAVGLCRKNKLEKLNRANGKFDVLKVLFRVAREVKIIDNKKYLSLEARIQIIGRMLGGWIKSLKETAPVI